MQKRLRGQKTDDEREQQQQELKLNLRSSSVTTMFNLIEIKMVTLLFFRVLNVYNCSNNYTWLRASARKTKNRPTNCLSKFRSTKMATLILALFLYIKKCVLF